MLPSSAPTVSCGITIREDRLAGAEGPLGEIVVRRAEVVSVALGSASLTELPWVEGLAGAVLALLTAFLVATRLDAHGHATRGLGAATLVGSAAVTLLGRSLYRRPALIVRLKSGDRRRLWTPGTAVDRGQLLALLAKRRWPVVNGP